MRKASDKINNFHFACNRILDKELGQFNSLVQFQEVAMLELLKKHKDSDKDLDDFIKNCAQNHNIPLNHVPFSKFQSKIHLSYLIYPTACLDKFFREWIQEVNIFLVKRGANPDGTDKSFKEDKSVNGSMLKKILSSLNKAGVGINFPELYSNIYDYYRLSRNQLAHSGDNAYEVENAYRKIDTKAALALIPSWEKAFSAPGVYELDDLIAYSAFSKRIADELSHLIYPKLNWTNVQINLDNDWKNFICKAKAKCDREVTLQGYVKQRYGEPIPECQIKSTMEHLGL